MRYRISYVNAVANNFLLRYSVDAKKPASAGFFIASNAHALWLGFRSVPKNSVSPESVELP